MPKPWVPGPAIALALIVLSATPAPALPDKTPAKALAGRVAGPPRSCISEYEGDSGGDIYDSGDILYRGRGSRIYVNHPGNCTALRSDRRIVIRVPASRQCRGDIIEVQDRIAPTGYGSCALGDFVPYDRPKAR